MQHIYLECVGWDTTSSERNKNQNSDMQNICSSLLSHLSSPNIYACMCVYVYISMYIYLDMYCEYKLVMKNIVIYYLIYSIYLILGKNFSLFFFSGELFIAFSSYVQIWDAIILHDLILLATKISLRWLCLKQTNVITHSLTTVILGPVNSFIKPDQLESFLPFNLKLEPWIKEGENLRHEMQS